MASLRRPPGPPSRGIIGNFPMASPDPLAVFTQWAREYGGIFHYRALNRHVYFLNHPDLIREVLVSQAANFRKGEAVRVNRRIFGNGLLASEGSLWSRQRRLIQPAFSRGHIETYADIMVERTQSMLASWRNGETRDIHQDMMRLTLEIVAKALFSVEIASDDDRVALALDTLMELSAGVRLLLPETIRRFPTPGNLRYQRATRELDEVVFGLIRERRTQRQDQARPSVGDLLDTLLQARYEDGGSMSSQQLRDEVMTLLLAGHETTAVSLSWTLLLLAEHPEAGQKLSTELDHVLAGRVPRLQDLPSLPFVERVIKESMRLYPPVWAITRNSIAACEIGGYQLPANSTVVMSQWVMHRDPQYHDRPESFLPDRWLEERSRAAPRFTFFPFGGGHRVCIGASFASTEAALVLAAIVQQYQLSRPSRDPVQPLASITLRPRGGIRLVLNRRQPA